MYKVCIVESKLTILLVWELVKLPQKGGVLYRAALAKRNIELCIKQLDAPVGLCVVLGQSRNTKHFQADMEYRINSVSYKLAPIITPNTESAITKATYLANHLFFSPNFMIRRTNFPIGLGAEIQYLSKVKITTQGEELHNIIDNPRFSEGGLFQLS